MLDGISPVTYIIMKVYKFNDFQVGMMAINGHQVNVVNIIPAGTVDKWTANRIEAVVDGGAQKVYKVSKLCEACGVEYAITRTGRTSGTKVVTAKTEEEKVAAKARLAYKDATKGLEAMKAAGLLSGKALATAKKELAAKIKAEQERLTQELVAEKARKAEEAKAKKAAKATATKFEKAAKALDALSVAELMDFIRKYQDNRLTK